MTFDPRLAYGIEVFALDDDEGDAGPMREAVNRHGCWREDHAPS